VTDGERKQVFTILYVGDTRVFLDVEGLTGFRTRSFDGAIILTYDGRSEVTVGRGSSQGGAAIVQEFRRVLSILLGDGVPLRAENISEANQHFVYIFSSSSIEGTVCCPSCSVHGFSEKLLIVKEEKEHAYERLRQAERFIQSKDMLDAYLIGLG
jgi:hypothetical protein